MQTYYSIAFCVLRPSLDEKISVGMALMNGGNILFRHSQRKVTAIAKYLPPHGDRLTKHVLRTLATTIEEEKNVMPDSRSLNSGLGLSGLLNEQYFSYLSKYSNNLLSFSYPAPVDLPLNEESLIALFRKFVDEPITEGVVIKSVIDVHNRLLMGVRYIIP